MSTEKVMGRLLHCSELCAYGDGWLPGGGGGIVIGRVRRTAFPRFRSGLAWMPATGAIWSRSSASYSSERPAMPSISRPKRPAAASVTCTLPACLCCPRQRSELLLEHRADVFHALLLSPHAPSRRVVHPTCRLDRRSASPRRLSATSRTLAIDSPFAQMPEVWVSLLSHARRTSTGGSIPLFLSA